MIACFYLSLDGAKDPYLLAEGVEEVGQIQVGQLAVEPFENQVQTGDDIATELQRQGRLDGATAPLQRRPVHTWTTHHRERESVSLFAVSHAHRFKNSPKNAAETGKKM